MKFPERHIVMPGRLYADARANLLCHRIIAHIGSHQRDNGWLTAAPAEIARALGRARPTLLPWLQSLVDWGYLERRGVGPQTAWRVILDPTDASVAGAVLAEAEGVEVSDTSRNVPVRSVEPLDTSEQPVNVGVSDNFIVKREQVSDTSTRVGKSDTSDSIEDSLGDSPRESGETVHLTSPPDARAREPSDFERICAEAGPWLVDASKDPRLRLSAHLIAKWKAAGADLDHDIIPTIAALTQEPPPDGEQITTLAYFTKAIRKQAAARLAPVDPITPEEARGSRARRLDQRQRFDVETIAAGADAYAAKFGIRIS